MSIIPAVTGAVPAFAAFVDNPKSYALFAVPALDVSDEILTRVAARLVASLRRRQARGRRQGDRCDPAGRGDRSQRDPEARRSARQVRPQFKSRDRRIPHLALRWKGGAIAYGTISPRVVPANAGIHNPCRRSCEQGILTQCQNVTTGVWIPAFAGRLPARIGAHQPMAPVDNLCAALPPEGPHAAAR